jgi:hypothetical protein
MKEPKALIDELAEWKAKICSAVPVPPGVVVTPESVANCPQTLAAIKAMEKYKAKWNRDFLYGHPEPGVPLDSLSPISQKGRR